MSAINEAVKKILAAALMLPLEDCNESTALGITPQWDSLAHMRLILALEEKTGQALTPEQIVSIGCFEDVADILSA